MAKARPDPTTERTWAAFLRGMNLGGRRLTNEELVAAVESCGCGDVRPYQASGNVVLVDARSHDVLLAALEDGLETSLGYAVPVVLRNGDEVRAIADATPFAANKPAASTGKPQVILVRETPTPPTMREVESLVPAGDRVVLVDRDLHWLPAAGIADNTMDFRRLDALTGGTTVRTLGTVQRLAAKFLDPRR